MNPKKNPRGFTLFEMVFAIGIFLLLIGAVVQIFLVSFKSSSIINDQLLAHRQGRRTVQEFVNEIRSATYSSLGAYPLATASSSEIIFYANIDSDNYVEKVRYYLTQTKLVKGITKPTGTPLTYSAEATSTIVEGIYNGGNPIFYYYDQN